MSECNLKLSIKFEMVDACGHRPESINTIQMYFVSALGAGYPFSYADQQKTMGEAPIASGTDIQFSAAFTMRFSRQPDDYGKHGDDKYTSTFTQSGNNFACQGISPAVALVGGSYSDPQFVPGLYYTVLMSFEGQFGDKLLWCPPPLALGHPGSFIVPAVGRFVTLNIAPVDVSVFAIA